jgi:hypothetical protein
MFVNMLALLLPIVLAKWYERIQAYCKYGWVPFFKGVGEDGNDQIYDCSRHKPMWRTDEISGKSCKSYGGCFLDENVKSGEVCLGNYCTLYRKNCYCDKIEDPFSLTDGCDACKFETPSPTYLGQCDCSEGDAVAFGLEDTNGVCQCEVAILEGDNCNGDLGSHAFNSGPFPFVKESCLWDPYTTSYRKISCFDENTVTIEWFSDTGCSALDKSYEVHRDTCYYVSGTELSVNPTDLPTSHPVESEAPTPTPTITDQPRLSGIVINHEICDRGMLKKSLSSLLYYKNDAQWIDDCNKLLATGTQKINIVCGCIGKISKSLTNEYLNCMLFPPYHGLSVSNMCRVSMYRQRCGSKCTRWLNKGKPIDAPTPNPTMTDQPTFSSIVINREICDTSMLKKSLSSLFYSKKDIQWIFDCNKLIATRTHKMNILCGCIGKFSKSLANEYLNCKLVPQYHGLQAWNMCRGSIYRQSCGSKCTRWLSKGKPIEAPTPNPTMTDQPTSSRVVVNRESCDTGIIKKSLSNLFSFKNDIQWIVDCNALLETKTQKLNIVCGCIGKFSKSLANEHLNCMLAAPYHGLQVWGMCQGSIHRQSCGSKCTGWLKRGKQRRRIDVDATFQLSWDMDMCSKYPTCSNDDGTMAIVEKCTCGSPLVFCSIGEYCNRTKRPNPCTVDPTETHRGNPTFDPTETPTTGNPTFAPTMTPTGNPTFDPTVAPTGNPTYYPSETPTGNPTHGATETPTGNPTYDVTVTPTGNPTYDPIETPTGNPTYDPTETPTKGDPTKAPTEEEVPRCVAVKQWTAETAHSVCPPELWGRTDRGYDTMKACDQSYHAALVKSAANGMFGKCNSWCIYDFNNVREGTKLGYIWKGRQGCWRKVRKHFCFRGRSLSDFRRAKRDIATICEGSQRTRSKKTERAAGGRNKSMKKSSTADGKNRSIKKSRTAGGKYRSKNKKRTAGGN